MVSFKKYGDSKDTLVLLHGWGGNWRSWRPIIERLKNNFTIYVVDLPGAGEKSLERTYELADYANLVKNFLDKEKISNPILVGHSFGGRVAIKLAATSPSSTSALVLVDSAGIRPKYSTEHHLWLVITKAGKTFFSLPIIKNFYYPGKKIFYEIRGLDGSDYSNLGDDENLKKTFVNILSEDLSGDIKKINLPVLIIWGQNDQETPLEDGRRIHYLLKDSKMIVFPNAGHFSYLDDQEKFCEEIKKFVKYAS